MCSTCAGEKAEPGVHQLSRVPTPIRQLRICFQEPPVLPHWQWWACQPDPEGEPAHTADWKAASSADASVAGLRTSAGLCRLLGGYRRQTACHSVPISAAIGSCLRSQWTEPLILNDPHAQCPNLSCCIAACVHIGHRVLAPQQARVQSLCSLQHSSSLLSALATASNQAQALMCLLLHGYLKLLQPV